MKNYRNIAIEIGELLKYQTTFNEIGRYASSLLTGIRFDNYPNESITSVRAKLIWDWICSLAREKINPIERDKKLISFVTSIAQSADLPTINAILLRNGIDKAMLEDKSTLKGGQPAPEQEDLNVDISTGTNKFKNDFSRSPKTAFIMMSFENTDDHNRILSCIVNTLHVHGIMGLRSDYKEYMDDLFPDVKVYMHCCLFGIAVVEEITKRDPNPNVSLEIGYMLGLHKNVLLLKDEIIRELPADLVGRLYKEFDTRNIEDTLPQVIEKWLKDKGYIN
jgi:hypothetical protein